MKYKILFTNEKTIKSNLKREIVEKIIKQIAKTNKLNVRLK